jgi:hypothetical protein
MITLPVQSKARIVSYRSNNGAGYVFVFCVGIEH